MDINDKIHNIKNKLQNLEQNQKDLIVDYEKFINEYQSSDLIKENENLKKSVETLKKTLESLKKEHEKGVEDNQKLRSALHDQILDEKLNILKISEEKLNTYFHDSNAKYSNRLMEINEQIKSQIDDAKKFAFKELDNERDSAIKELSSLYEAFREKLKKRKEQQLLRDQDLRNRTRSEIDILRNEEISEEVMLKRMKQNELEMKIGLSWVNKIGILLILIGVIAAFQYTYATWLNNNMKGISFYILGAVFIGAGEWFHRGKKNTFTLGLLGGGVSIWYLSTFFSYFLLKIIDLNLAFILAVLITTVTIVFSLRYDSRTVCTFGLIGGYLPVLTYFIYFQWKEEALYVAMAYLFILNMAILIISLSKRWLVINYISMLSHLPALLYLVFNAKNTHIAIVYSIVAFFMYLVITLAYPFKYKISLNRADLFLLGINTLFNCSILYALLQKAGLKDWNGYLALIFCVVYFGLGEFIKRNMKEERNTMILFFSTSLTFAILTIPFQFGIKWLSMGWLLEGLILTIYALKNKLKKLETSGVVIFVVCIVIFYFFDLLTFWSGQKEFFDFKYFSIIAGEILLLVIYLKEMAKGEISEYSDKAKNIDWFKYFTLANLWVYLIYLGMKIYNTLIPENIYNNFYIMLIFSIITIAFAYIIPKIPLLKDENVKQSALCMYLLGDIVCIYINFFIPVSINTNNPAFYYLSLTILILYNIFMFFNLRDLVIYYIKEKNYNLEIYPLIMSILLFGNISAFLIIQFKLGNNNLLFSFIYLGLAISYIAYGFVRRFSDIRRFGLALALFATAKLFIYDLSFLQTIWKIISYFVFGLILLGISFIYQKMKDRADIKIVEKKEQSEDIS